MAVMSSTLTVNRFNTCIDSFWNKLIIEKNCKSMSEENVTYEPPRDKTNNVAVRPAKTQISLAIRPVWSVSSLSAWRKLGSLATHWAHSEDSDQTGRMSRLIRVLAGRILTLLVLSRGGSVMMILMQSIKAIGWGQSLTLRHISFPPHCNHRGGTSPPERHSGPGSLTPCPCHYCSTPYRRKIL